MVGRPPLIYRRRPTDHPIHPALQCPTDHGWSADGRPTFWPTIDHPSTVHPPAAGRGLPRRLAAGPGRSEHAARIKRARSASADRQPAASKTGPALVSSRRAIGAVRTRGTRAPAWSVAHHLAAGRPSRRPNSPGRPTPLPRHLDGRTGPPGARNGRPRGPGAGARGPDEPPLAWPAGPVPGRGPSWATHWHAAGLRQGECPGIVRYSARGRSRACAIGQPGAANCGERGWAAARRTTAGPACGPLLQVQAPSPSRTLPVRHACP